MQAFKQNAGPSKVLRYAFAAGESSKNRETKAGIEDRLHGEAGSIADACVCQCPQDSKTVWEGSCSLVSSGLIMSYPYPTAMLIFWHKGRSRNEGVQVRHP